MRQFKITTANLTPADENDCMLLPDDPLHDMMAVSQIGGIGSDAALANYNSLGKPVIKVNNKGQIQREQNIKPGTEEWFKLWFSREKQ